MTTQFNKTQFIAQFATFSPSNDWEYKFGQSLHKQVVLWKKDLSEKQVACWEKMIAPKIVLGDDKLNDETKTLISKCEKIICMVSSEEKDKFNRDFPKSIIEQLKLGNALSSKQTYHLNRIYKAVVETPNFEAVETPKVETPKKPRVAKAKVAKVVEIEEIPFESTKTKTKTKTAK